MCFGKILSVRVHCIKLPLTILISVLKSIYTLLQMFRQFYLFMMQNAYVLEGGNEGGRKATPTSISIFDFYGIKTL